QFICNNQLRVQSSMRSVSRQSQRLQYKKIKKYINQIYSCKRRVDNFIIKRPGIDPGRQAD
ncbi:hypothetical protein, partial [Bacillus canaveralius]|uniref:hypothetical protein n=1 Tax=Bacillus canaveralius TaxID=1403243 RepID=UPI001C60CA20